MQASPVGAENINHAQIAGAGLGVGRRATDENIPADGGDGGGESTAGAGRSRNEAGGEGGRDDLGEKERGSEASKRGEESAEHGSFIAGMERGGNGAAV